MRRNRRRVPLPTRPSSDAQAGGRAHSRGNKPVTKGLAMNTAHTTHTTRSGRALTPARIVALALIAVLIGGIASLRLATGTDQVKVPAHAKAGDLVLRD